MSQQLPADLSAKLQALLDGVSRRDLAASAHAISTGYRAGGHSSAVVGDAHDALAYAVARMPATFAATLRALLETAQRMPDLAPRSLLDLGAGPGTAAHAARQAFPTVERVRLVEPNPRMRDLATRLLPDAHIEPAAIDARWSAKETADLVVMSYVLAEHAVGSAPTLARAAFAAARDVLALVEPGTPHGFARLQAARTALIDDGAHVIAPCPHATACPMVTPDWCHFRVRLPRSRDHLLLKGAEVPFEDEPFCYLAVSRRPATPPRIERVLREPTVDKATVTLTLCTPSGLDVRRVLRRNKEGYKAAKAILAGDAIPAAPGADA